MKVFIKVFIFLITVTLIFFVYLYRYTPKQRKGFNNIANSKKIKKGFTKKNVLVIMGKPDSFQPDDSGKIILNYQPPITFSDEIRIVIDSSGYVIKVLSADD
ncbi:MAG: hypothetical protein RIQ33_309 [Bacteroidota bacterium]